MLQINSRCSVSFLKGNKIYAWGCDRTRYISDSAFISHDSFIYLLYSQTKLYLNVNIVGFRIQPMIVRSTNSGCLQLKASLKVCVSFQTMVYNVIRRKFFFSFIWHVTESSNRNWIYRIWIICLAGSRFLNLSKHGPIQRTRFGWLFITIQFKLPWLRIGHKYVQLTTAGFYDHSIK